MSELIINPVVSFPPPSALFQSVLVETARSYSGQIATLKTRKTLDLKKSAPTDLLIEKESVFQVRIGVSYENKAAVKEIREEGKEAVSLESKGWNMVEFPFLVRSIKKEKYALAVSSVLNGNHSRKYFLNGNEVAQNEVEQYLYAKDFATKEESPLWFTVYLENILAIN